MGIKVLDTANERVTQYFFKNMFSFLSPTLISIELVDKFLVFIPSINNKTALLRLILMFTLTTCFRAIHHLTGYEGEASSSDFGCNCTVNSGNNNVH